MKRLKSLITNTGIVALACWLCLLPTRGVFAQPADSGTLYLVYRNGKWGYNDKRGKTVIKPQFKGANFFVKGMAEVWRADNGQRQFIDLHGNVIADRNFASDHFSEGLIPIKIENKYGYADEQGEILIFPRFENAGDFSDGLAPVVINKKWGYINHAGRFVIQPQFDEADSFSEGLAAVGIAKQATAPEKQDLWHEIFSSDNPFQSTSHYGFINKRGDFVIAPTYDLVGSFSEGLAGVNMGGYNNLFGGSGAARWGFVDKTGKVIIELKFNSAGDFSEGLAAARVGEKYGYIDKSGAIVIAPKFESASEFQDGLAYATVGWTSYKFRHSVVHIGFHGKQGYIDKTGRYVSDKLNWHS